AAIWPEGVVARAITRHGTPIDVTVSGRGGNRMHHAACDGCGRSKDTPASHTGDILPVLLAWVDDHATTCAFLPRPTRTEGAR
ncbi:hypothetical protein, partial [Actinocorallia libanotica]